MSNIPSIEALEGAHDFPSRYTFKLFGENSERFRVEVQQLTTDVAGGLGAPRFSERTSRGDRHLCITVEVMAQNAHHVQAFYTAYREVRKLRLLL